MGGLADTITVARKKISLTVYVERDQETALKALRDKTGIPMAVLIRDAIDLGLARWTDETESVLTQAEDFLVESKAEAGEDADAYLGPTHLVELLANHARQLQLERDQAHRLAMHYRACLRTAQETLSEALAPAPALRQAVSR